MSTEREAAQIVERWVSLRVAPQVRLLFDHESYRPVPIEGMYRLVRLQRTNAGSVEVTCSNDLIVEALKKLFGETCLVRDTPKSPQSHIVSITPKSE